MVPKGLKTLYTLAMEPLSTLSLAFLALAPLVFGATLCLLYRLRHWLLARHMIDHVNERSSHTIPTPRGGGLAIVLVLLPALAVFWGLGGQAHPGWWGILLVTGLIAALSFLDDRASLPAMLRFGIQAILVAIGLFLLPSSVLTIGGSVPAWIGAPVAFLAWLWFVNLYNFMDGIDGLCGGQSVVLGFGFCLLTFCLPLSAPSEHMLLGGMFIAASALGFLVLNWHPARLFMGDVGSIALGYLLGGLLLLFVAEGWWPVALILPAYYWGDATLTLLRRAVRREAIWRAHRSHAYQRAVHKAGLKPDETSLWIIAIGVICVGVAAILPAIGAWIALVVVLALVLALIAAFGGAGVREVKPPAETVAAPHSVTAGAGTHGGAGG